jgi:predicted dehydrogenase
MDRRQFLQSTAAAGVALGSGAALAADDKPLRVGVIGCGWFGNVDRTRLMEVTAAKDTTGVEIVSLCDVDKKQLQDTVDDLAKAGRKKPQLFADYREMLKPKELDIVIVGSPDHWHPLHLIAAVESGAHVYVEKPISRDIREGRAMVDAARKNKRVVQVGTQRRSTAHFQSARDFVREGKLGTVGLARAYCFWHMRGQDDPADCDPPATLDYEFWAGPAPKIPYNPLIHPKTWRKFMEYGNGILGDMGVHMLDSVRWTLGLKHPKKVFSTGGIYVEKKGKSNITDTQQVTYDFGDVTVVWEHRMYGTEELPTYGWGVSYYGDKGTLRITLDGWDFTPFGDGKAVKVEAEADPKSDDPKVAPANRRHMQNFLAAIKSGDKPIADIEEGHVSTSLCVLGNLSQQLGRSLTWDGAKEQVVGDNEANKLLVRPYREPWVHPGA